MKASEHFREAERFLKIAFHGETPADVQACLARAQVHATLALAGATAVTNYSMDDRDDWEAAFAGYRLVESDVPR